MNKSMKEGVKMPTVFQRINNCLERIRTKRFVLKAYSLLSDESMELIKIRLIYLVQDHYDCLPDIDESLNSLDYITSLLEKYKFSNDDYRYIRWAVETEGYVA